MQGFQKKKCMELSLLKDLHVENIVYMNHKYFIYTITTVHILD